MRTVYTLALFAMLFTSFSLLVSCDDDDDDNNDDDNNVADDDVADDDDAVEEEPCFTQAKLDAQAYCTTLGLEANLTHIGLNSAGGLTCYYYCGGGDYFLEDECRGGTCICCQ